MIAPALIASAGALAVLELDATSAGQLMVSRPAVFGPALGAAFGQPALGTGLGALWELLSLDELPCGGHLPINATVAAGACLLLALGEGAAAPEIAFPIGIAASLVHGRLEVAMRKRRAAMATICEERLARGEDAGLGVAVSTALLKQATMTFAVLAAVLALRPTVALWFPRSFDAVQEGMRLGLSLAPWAGMVALLHALRTVR